MKNSGKLFSSAVLAVIVFALAACGDLFLEMDVGIRDFIQAGPPGGKLTITNLDEFNGDYVVAFGFNENYEYLFGAEKVSPQFVFTGSKITGNKAELNVWHQITENTLVGYDCIGKFTFLIYVIKKPSLSKAEEFTIGDYLYKGKEVPWVTTVGIMRGYSIVDGEFEGAFELHPILENR